MKVGVVIAARWFRASIDMDGYCAALRRAGHAPVLICRGNDAGRADFPVVEASAEEMRTSAFWRAQSLDAAIVFCWLREASLLRALASSGAKTLLRADGDGRASARWFPEAAWLATVSPARGLWDFLRRARHWARRWAVLWKEEDAELLATAEAADAIAEEFPRAARNLRTLFLRSGRPELGEKVRVVPHSVSDRFRAALPPPNASRPRRVFCLGRWEDPQKDAPLLAATIARLLREDPSVEALIAGTGMDEHFSRFRTEPRARLLGKIPPETTPAFLNECRVFLSASRWEGQSVIGLEALCMGTTIVSPPVPCFQDFAEEGDSGRIAPRRSAAALARAAREELDAWESGLRAPEKLAARWRPRVSNDAVVAGLLDALAARRPLETPHAD